MAFKSNVFFSEVRKFFPSSRLSQAQVDGIEAILASAKKNNVKLTHHVAQILAQVYRETGSYMSPIKETVMPSAKNKNPSDATVIARLNKAWADGKLKGVKTPYWRDGAFGRGPIQITHWDNYVKFGKALGVPLRENPSLALDGAIGADIAVIGMRDGMFRNKKLSDYSFPSALDAKPANHPRRIVNGNDGSDAEVSTKHRQFYTALVTAGWDETPVPVKVNMYDGKFNPTVLAAQEKLDSLGYPEVGEFDGKWGRRTAAAVLAFRSDNGLPLVAAIDEHFLATLMVAEPRQEASCRKDATIKDLRAVGAEDVKQADQTQVAGYVLAGSGTVVGASKILDQVDQHSETLTRIADAIHPLVNFVQDNFWLLLIGGGAFFVWKSGILKRIRLEKHQTGRDVSE